MSAEESGGCDMRQRPSTDGPTPFECSIMPYVHSPSRAAQRGTARGGCSRDWEPWDAYRAYRRRTTVKPARSLDQRDSRSLRSPANNPRPTPRVSDTGALAPRWPIPTDWTPLEPPRRKRVLGQCHRRRVSRLLPARCLADGCPRASDHRRRAGVPTDHFLFHRTSAPCGEALARTGDVR